MNLRTLKTNRFPSKLEKFAMLIWMVFICVPVTDAFRKVFATEKAMFDLVPGNNVHCKNISKFMPHISFSSDNLYTLVELVGICICRKI